MAELDGVPLKWVKRRKAQESAFFGSAAKMGDSWPGYFFVKMVDVLERLAYCGPSLKQSI